MAVAFRLEFVTKYWIYLHDTLRMKNLEGLEHKIWHEFPIKFQKSIKCVLYAGWSNENPQMVQINICYIQSGPTKT